jgi:hypothetical protein
MPYLNPPPLGTAAATFNAPELASGYLLRFQQSKMSSNLNRNLIGFIRRALNPKNR